MRKQGLVLCTVLSLLFLPGQMSSIASTRPHSTVSLAKVLTDIQEQQAAEQPVSATAEKVEADEWSHVAHVIKGEQLKQTDTTTLEMIEATKAWEQAQVKGEGMLISIIDTGINATHPDLSQITDKRLAKQKTGREQKVIAGYNWADRNEVTSDAGESQHGTHVAGIAAANGKMKGVAPEAQLLSQKVFSNYHGEVHGLSESILFAINDSINKKADVINLSLGSSAGYVDDLSVEQYAIKRAVDHGVVVVAAAGNDGYFGSDKVKQSNPDFAMVGSPGLAPDALSVASANATSLAGTSFAVTGVPDLQRVVYMNAYAEGGATDNPAHSLINPYQLVYVGKGKKADYNIDVKNKIVLVERGDIPFEEKLKLARQAGAAGVILYNNEPGPLFINANEAKHIPAVSILQQTGQQLAQQLKRGKKVTVEFDGEYSQNPLPYPNGGTISAFSSWGPTPNLLFKPDITAPGGGVLSTVGEAGYGVKSGTSMATPHVAGGMALIKQAYQKLGRDLQGRELVETLKAAVMNTAQPILDARTIAKAAGGEKGRTYPYSPRVQGAGMMQIAKAIQTPVIITDSKGKAGVSLGEINHRVTFSLFVSNKFGTKPITYQISDAFGVLTDLYQDGYNQMMDVLLPGASLQFSPRKVTVAAGETKEVKVTLSIPKTAPRNIFSEGYVRFTPEDQSLPTLHVPYYGFYGKWDEPRIMDAPMWDDSSQEKRTGVKTTWFLDKQNDKYRYRDYLGISGVDDKGRAKVNPDRIAFSPNGDGHYDVAAPSITFLRNAKRVTIDVVDKQGNLIRSLVNDEKVSKFDQTKLGLPFYYTEKEEWAWDGTTYSAEKGTYETVPDGEYQFVIRAKIDEPHANWQTLTLPVRVDTKPPKVHLKRNGQELSWSSADKDVQGYLLYVDGKKQGGPYPPEQTTLNIGKAHRNITLVAYDFAGNFTFTSLDGQSDTTPPVIQFPHDLYRQVLVTKQPLVALSGKVAGEDLLDQVKLAINQEPVEVDYDGSFQTVLSLPEGLNYVSYSVTDVYGNNRQFTQRVLVDSQPPQLSLQNDGTEEALFDANSKTALLPVRIGYEDHNFKGRVSINGQIIANWEEEQLEKGMKRSITHQLQLHHGPNKLLVEGRDYAGNLASMMINAYVDAYSGSLVLQKGEQVYQYKAKQAPPLSIRLNQEKYTGKPGETLVVEGQVNLPPGLRLAQLAARFNGQQVLADLGETGAFRLAVDVENRTVGKMTIVARDVLGREANVDVTIQAADPTGHDQKK